MHKLDASLAVGAGSLLALTGMGAAAGLAPTAPAVAQEAPAPAVIAVDGTAPAPRPAVVEGDFAYTQTEVDSLDTIKANIGGTKYLCGSNVDLVPTAPENWTLKVTGAVNQEVEATFEELCATTEVQSTLMGCSCAGNPVDGRASVNAEITGIPLMALLSMAGVESGANTVVFSSADGYEVALPLTYVTQRYCPIVFAVNGADLAESVGGTNQLWLGATSAKYFARDITTITLEQRDVVPAAPGAEEDDATANLPNVGVFFGGEVE